MRVEIRVVYGLSASCVIVCVSVCLHVFVRLLHYTALSVSVHQVLQGMCSVASCVGLRAHM